jgi:hypothetical protein
MPYSWSTGSGQLCRVDLNGGTKFLGIIQDTTLKQVEDGHDQFLQDVKASSLSDVAGRMTVFSNSWVTGTLAATIITDMVSQYLCAFGITIGTMGNGYAIGASTNYNGKNIKNVIDELANSCGYTWNIFADGKIYFMGNQGNYDGILCPYALVDGNEFYDYRNIIVSESLENYANRIVITGGTDSTGNQITVMREDLNTINAEQMLTGHAGVYTTNKNDSELTEMVGSILQAGSNTTTSVVPGHTMQVGDFFWNTTKGIYAWVTRIISSSSWEHTVVAGQASGNSIKTYRNINDIATNFLKKNAGRNETIEFESFNHEFNANSRLIVDINDMSVTGYYNIDSVQTQDRGGNIFTTKVKATLRQDDDFSNQKTTDYIDWFRGLKNNKTYI